MRLSTGLGCLALSALLAATPALAGCSSSATSDTSTADKTDESSTSSTDSTTTTYTTTGKNTGKKVSVNYIGTYEDGTEFDNSYTRGTPLEFTVGTGQMISGFDEAVSNMDVGQTVTVTLTPDEAYGEVDPNLIITYDKADVPNFDDLSVGDTVYLSTTSGGTVAATVTDKTDDTVTVDANSAMAGKTLVFQIELLSVE